MKKHGLLISALMMALSANVAGAEVIGSISETEEGVAPGMKKITISGNVSVEDNDDLVSNAVTLVVLKEGIGISEDGSIDLSEIDEYGDGSQIEHTYQTTAADDGAYSFSYTMSGLTGNYLIRIGYTAKSDDDTTQKVYKYISPADFLNFEEGLDEAFSKKNDKEYDSAGKIIELVEEYSKKGVLEIPVYDEMEKDEEVLRFIGEFILSSEKPENMDDFAKKFEEGFLTELLHKKTADEIKSFFENEKYVALLNIDKEVLDGFSGNDEKQKEKVFDALAGKDLEGKEFREVKDNICSSMVLSEFDSLLWQGNLQVLEKYKNYLGIDFGKYNSLKSAEKKNYAMTEFSKELDSLKNADGVKEIFDEAVKKAEKYSSGKGNSYSDSRKESSGGGGGGGTTIMTEISNVKLPSTEVKQEEKPDTEEKAESIFDDLENYSWASEAINTLAKKNIVAGDGNGKFRPGDEVKREEFLKMILTGLELKERDADVLFSDVTPDKWYYDYIKGGIYYHFVNGIGDNEFGVGRPIKRADVSVIIDRVLKMYGKEYSVKEIVYQDVLKDEFSYAYDAIYRVSEAKLMNGISQTKFEPARSITRAEAAVVVDRVMKLLENN